MNDPRTEKLLQYLMSIASEQPLDTIEQTQATIDYNIMMGNLDSPEEDA